MRRGIPLPPVTGGAWQPDLPILADVAAMVIVAAPHVWEIAR